MFESVASDIHEVRQQRARFYRTLPASLLFHGIAILAVPIGASWTVEFPTHSPGMMVSYNLAEVPPPPPPPPPPAPPKQQIVPEAKVPEVVPEQIVAPNFIPDQIVPVTEPPPPPSEAVADGVEGGIEGGVVGGVVGGTPEGVPGGIVGGKLASVVDDSRVVIPRDEKLELYPLSKNYPVYPGKAQKNRWQDQLVVRYVIGTNGRVKEATIIQPAEREMFDHAALEAIRTWRFRPMIKDGKKVEVVHELTVFFRLRQSQS
jgi:protein TonB